MTTDRFTNTSDLQRFVSKFQTSRVVMDAEERSCVEYLHSQLPLPLGELAWNPRPIVLEMRHIL